MPCEQGAGDQRTGLVVAGSPAGFDSSMPSPVAAPRPIAAETRNILAAFTRTAASRAEGSLLSVKSRGPLGTATRWHASCTALIGALEIPVSAF
jgi:hypothetical protein